MAYMVLRTGALGGGSSMSCSKFFGTATVQDLKKYQPSLPSS